ncbi:uncharacterized protein PADG_02613 [Paracoccidioides brasiliensis Pb18]|uniref:Uncharacterized protein n=1 Tax=Paracoccidioides brasiliensis (strain Pb18) TaxID=502780 RepID=C1G608_PARBD|nr:uncharacterized protein PADG_02613 [Paracoccidioides brasiliensis Pb18]EEH46515.2 hypothetical protein PADG_02613 [Paracoccidioides brasiliensis Pb18]
MVGTAGEVCDVCILATLPTIIGLEPAPNDQHFINMGALFSTHWEIRHWVKWSQKGPMTADTEAGAIVAEIDDGIVYFLTLDNPRREQFEETAGHIMADGLQRSKRQSSSSNWNSQPMSTLKYEQYSRPEGTNLFLLYAYGMKTLLLFKKHTVTTVCSLLVKGPELKFQRLNPLRGMTLAQKQRTGNTQAAVIGSDSPGALGVEGAYSEGRLCQSAINWGLFKKVTIIFLSVPRLRGRGLSGETWSKLTQVGKQSHAAGSVLAILEFRLINLPRLRMVVDITGHARELFSPDLVLAAVAMRRVMASLFAEYHELYSLEVNSGESRRY